MSNDVGATRRSPLQDGINGLTNCKVSLNHVYDLNIVHQIASALIFALA